MTIFNPKSKTHLYGAAVGIFAALLEFMPTIESMINPAWYSWIFAGLGIGIIIFRNVTTQPVEDKESL